MMRLIYKRVSSDDELNQILAIQLRNIKSSLSQDELNQEGFITVNHDFDILKK